MCLNWPRRCVFVSGELSEESLVNRPCQTNWVPTGQQRHSPPAVGLRPAPAGSECFGSMCVRHSPAPSSSFFPSSLCKMLFNSSLFKRLFKCMRHAPLSLSLSPPPSSLSSLSLSLSLHVSRVVSLSLSLLALSLSPSFRVRTCTHAPDERHSQAKCQKMSDEDMLRYKTEMASYEK